MRNPRTLQRRWFLLAAGLGTLSVLLISVAFLFGELDRRSRQLDQQATALSSLLASAALRADHDAVAAALAVGSLDPLVVAACAYDGAGVVVASHRVQTRAGCTALAEDPTLRAHAATSDRAGISVELYRPASAVLPLLKEHSATTALIFASTLTLLLFAAWKLGGHAVAPLRRLGERMDRLDLEAPEAIAAQEDPSEVGDLAVRFDRAVTRLVGSRSDVRAEVSQRRAAQQAERSARELLREIIDLLPCLVFARRGDSELLFANRAVADAYGTTLDELLLGSFAASYEGTRPDGLLFSGTDVASSAEEVWFTTPGGEARRFLVSSVPYLDDEATLVIGVDVTREHSLQLQLQFSQRLEVIGTLAGGIAHDFNNLLTPILGYTSLLRASDLPADAKDKLDAVQAAADRARLLVQQILTFSRQQEPIAERRVQAIDESLEEALQLLRASVPADIHMTTRLEASTPVAIDAGQLHQVIVNLCTNAAQAISGPDGQIDVRLSEIAAGDARIPPHLDKLPHACIEVEDNGSGMAREVINHVFEPFFTTKGVGEGSGLGLSIVHGIVTSHDGDISVESQPGRGSVFRVLLPAAREDAPSDESATRVMLVDDEPAVLRVTHELLSTQGYAVETHTDPRAAWRALMAAPGAFDVLVTDHNMPQMSGAELARKVRRLRPNIPIVLITGFASPEPEELEGIDHKVMKPISGRELAIVIEQTLAARNHAA